MNAIAAGEIKRRGIGAVDSLLKKDKVVFVIQKNQPKYVVLSMQSYEDWSEELETSYRVRLQNSFNDLKKGRIRKYPNARALIKTFALDDN